MVCANERRMKAPLKKSARAPRSSKQGILVLGMHRSGTSALTRVLNLLGCALPANLIGPGDGNELGHWEAIDAVALNDEILASAGSSWDDWGPINEDWRQSGLRPEMMKRITALVEVHAELGPLFAVKDPRICRIADLWLEGMDAADIEPLVVLMVRNPAEVIRSLESRDLMAPSYGQLLWLRHVLDAEFASRGRKRVVCRYDQLMRNWYGTIAGIRSGLGVSLPRNSRKTHAEIEAFLSREQQHQSVELEAALDDPWLSEWVRRTLAIMVRWSEQGETSNDFGELDAIRREFDNSYVAFAGLLLNSDGAGSVGSGSHLRRELSEQLVNAQNAAERAQAVIAEADAREAAAAKQRAELASQIETAEAQAAAFQAELEVLRSESVRLGEEAAQVELLRQREAELCIEIENTRGMTEMLEAELRQLKMDADQRQQITTALEVRISALENALEIAREESRAATIKLVVAEEKLETAARELDRQAEHNAELAGRLTISESALVQRQEELAQLWHQLIAAEKALSAAEAQATLERERRTELDARSEVLAEQASQLRDELEAACKEKADFQRDWATRSEEIAKLTMMLQDLEEKGSAANVEHSRLQEEVAKLLELQAQSHAALQQRETECLNEKNARITVERQLTARFDEIAHLTNLLAGEGLKSEIANSNFSWLRQVNQLTQGFPKWWIILPKAFRLRKEHARYKRAGLFDAQGYLDLYPDVAADGMDPVRHYILHGMMEGRTRVE